MKVTYLTSASRRRSHRSVTQFFRKQSLMRSRAVLLTLCVLFPGVAFSQAASPIDGVWKIAEVVTTGANAATNATPMASLIMFARGHYSWININGTTARTQSPAAKDPAKLTEAEKLARFEEWQSLTAQSGTFEVKGTTLMRRATVAKNVGAMTAKNPNIQEFKLEGNTLWLTSRSAAGQPASETRTKLTRVR